MDEFQDVRLSLAAYNAGATPVRRFKRVPPYRETQDYVKKVLAVYSAGSRVSITRAGRTHSIQSQGGKIRVTQHGTPATAPPAVASGTGVARPVAQASSATTGPATAAEDAALAVVDEPAVSPPAGPLYYRYEDDLGAIHISRTQPSDVEYEVLEP